VQGYPVFSNPLAAHVVLDALSFIQQEGYHPIQICGDEMMIRIINYIHNNPVKRGFVDRPQDWRYSSVRNYLGMDALIPVTLFEY